MRVGLPIAVQTLLAQYKSVADGAGSLEFGLKKGVSR